MIGPGKYDDLVTQAREAAEAEGVVLAIINGNQGEGFSAQFATLELAEKLPAMLREMADQIELDTRVERIIENRKGQDNGTN